MYRCRWCEYRHGGCLHGTDDKLDMNCKEFHVGGCYSCKYYHGKNGKLNEKELNQWYKRGCETCCPSSLFCDKRKRISRKRKRD